MVPGSTVEQFVAGATSKKLDGYIGKYNFYYSFLLYSTYFAIHFIRLLQGCDWIHEISITVRTVHPTNIPNERAQRCTMLESKSCFHNLLSVACLKTADK